MGFSTPDHKTNSIQHGLFYNYIRETLPLQNLSGSYFFIRVSNIHTWACLSPTWLSEPTDIGAS